MRHLLLTLLLTTQFLCAGSLDTEVGQCFMCYLNDEDVESFLETSHIGNVIYFAWANNLTKKDEVLALSNTIKQKVLNTTGHMPLIAVDQEGGRVSRLSGEFTKPMSAGECADLSPTEAYKTGLLIGKELKEAGLNCDMAPVVDIYSNPLNTVMKGRCYGTTPTSVASRARAFMGGLQKRGVLSSIKHFPGHGDVGQDSHTGLPSTDRTLDELMERELLPFIWLKDQTDLLMTAHVLVPAIDKDNPATSSHKILTGLLREQIGYQGVIISDSIVMRGIAPDQATLEEATESVALAAIKAFNAGCDMLILGAPEFGDFEYTKEEERTFRMKVLQRFKEAVISGEIAKERFENALGRIYKLKEKIQ